MQQAGSTPFLHPEKGLYPEVAFDRSPQDTCPVPRPLRIGRALQSAYSPDAALLAPPLAITAVPLALHSSRRRVCLLGSSPEVLLPTAHISPEQVGGEVEGVRPSLRRNGSSVRKRQELDAEEGLGNLSPFFLILHEHTHLPRPEKM